MKILKKALISLSIILLNTTNVYATTRGTYVPEPDLGIGKLFLLVVAIGLVALVLFLGYKMDKNEMQEKRKEKIKKQRDNDIYSKIYTSYDNKSENIETEIEEKEELPEINFAPKTEEYFKNSLNDATQKLDIVNENEIDAYTSLKPDVEKVEDAVVYEEVEEDGYTEEEDVYESEDFGETQVISLKEDDDEVKSLDSTMVFDTPINNLDINMDVEEKIINKISDIKGYDYEDDDMDLLDLEQTIAEANIKKYTRDKNQEMIKVKRVPKKKEAKKEDKKENKSEKKYTRKKSEKKTAKKEETKAKKETTGKKYTAKKSTNKTKKEEKTKVEETKTKKYTKAKDKKTESKEEKPKRGRKPSTKK